LTAEGELMFYYVDVSDVTQ